MPRNLLKLKALPLLGILFLATFSLFAQTGTTPVVPANSVVNNASFAATTTPLAPGMIAAIFGSDLDDGSSNESSSFASNGKMLTTLGGASVTFNGILAPIFSAFPGQLNVQIPLELAGLSSASVQVTVAGKASPPQTVPIGAYSPGIFTIPSGGTGQGAIQISNTVMFAAPQGSIPGAQAIPVSPGQFIAIFCTGLGAVSNPPASGAPAFSSPLSTTMTMPQVSIGGIPANVSFSGLAPGYVGLYQVNVQVPGVASGNAIPVVLTIGGAQSNRVTIAVSAPPQISFYVATNGSDSWSGTLAAPNSTKTDGPFATIARAQQAVRSILSNSQGRTTPLVIAIRGGTYSLAQPLEFASPDSGTAAFQVLWLNYPGETPLISGGMRVVNWTNTGGNRWQTTLPASTQYFEQLFYNGQRRLRPRLGGYLGTYLRFVGPMYLAGTGSLAQAPNPNCSVYVDGKGWECFDRFPYNPSDPISNAWQNLAPPLGNACGATAGNPNLVGDIELTDFEFFTAPKLRVSCIDAANHIVYLTGPTAIQQTTYYNHGFLVNHRYVLENIKDALTQPGQWFLDRSTGPWTLTYLANSGENPNSDAVVIPQLPQVLVASGLQYVTFEGLSFANDNYTVPAAGHVSLQQEASISTTVSCQNCQHVTFDSVVMSQTSGGGLEFISCVNSMSPAWCASVSAGATTDNNTVQNSAFYDLGAMGIRVGVNNLPIDTDANVPQFTAVQNNVIAGYGRVFPAAFGISQGDGHDNTYTHNDIYDGYHAAISICSPPCSPGRSNSNGAFNNTISFNHVYNLLQGIMDDGGSLYFATGGPSFAASGNRLLNNKVHDVSDASSLDADGYGGNGLYLDNQSGMVDVENNLVYRVSDSAMFITQAPPLPNEAHTIKNNIFAFGRLGMITNGNPYPSRTCPASPIMTFTASNNLIYFDRTESLIPAFYVQRGCTYSCGFPYPAYQNWQSNLYWRSDGRFANDSKAFHVQPKAGATSLCVGLPTWTFLDFTGWQATGEDAQSAAVNPGFANPAYPFDDFSLPAGPPGAGFVVFDASRAGRSDPVIVPPVIAPGFTTAPFNPAKDY